METGGAMSNGKPQWRLPSNEDMPNKSATLGATRWAAQGGMQTGIWSNNSVIGTGFPQRETPGSRGSDEASPTAPSGSAQLTELSEAEPALRRPFWNTQEVAHDRRASGSASPSHTRDNVISQNGLSNGQFFTGTSALGGQNGSAFPAMTRGSTSLNPSSRAFRTQTPMFDETPNDDMNTSTSLPPAHSRLSDSYAVPFQGGDQEPTFTTFTNAFANLGLPSRGPSAGVNSRPSDFAMVGSSYLPGDAGSYGFDANVSSNPPLNQTSRPGMSQHSMSFPLNGASTRGPSTSHISASRDLNGYSRQSYPFDDSMEYDGSPMPNIHRNSTSQQFNIGTGPQTWSDGLGNGRGAGQAYQSDQFAASLYDPSRRHSSVHTSLSGSGPHSHMSSPRFVSAPTPRVDRPSSRHLRDRDRSQGSSQLPSHSASAQFSPSSAVYGNFYGSNFASEYNQGPNGYGVYNANSRFQNQVPLSATYSLPLSQTMIPGVNVPAQPRKDMDPAKLHRSGILENFRASSKSTKKWELKEIYGFVVEFAGDQHGSRFIQDKLVTANSDEKERVFREIEGDALVLMKDVFGNYVIQKFFEHGNQVQKHILAAKMKNKVQVLSTQMYACRVVQKALDHVLVEQQREIINELKPDIMATVQDQNGNHVVQKIISMAEDDDEFVTFVMQSFRGQIRTLAAHSYGCRVVQRLLEKEDETIRRSLMEEIHACGAQLIVDQYGNYVAQHIISHPSTRCEDRRRLISLVADDPISLSKHKFASNVVEKAIEYGTPDERRTIRANLTRLGPDGISPLQALMKDQFGNYVVQKMLTTLDVSEKRSFAREVEPQLALLKKNNTGPKIGSLERLVENALRETASRASEGDTQDEGALRPSVRTPTTPGLQLDVSGVPTPGLTTEHNSPDSSSPPSTHLSTTDETISDGRQSKINPSDAGETPVVVHVDDAER